MSLLRRFLLYHGFSRVVFHASALRLLDNRPARATWPLVREPCSPCPCQSPHRNARITGNGRNNSPARPVAMPKLHRRPEVSNRDLPIREVRSNVSIPHDKIVRSVTTLTRNRPTHRQLSRTVCFKVLGFAARQPNVFPPTLNDVGPHASQVPPDIRRLASFSRARHSTFVRSPRQHETRSLQNTDLDLLQRRSTEDSYQVPTRLTNIASSFVPAPG